MYISPKHRPPLTTRKYSWYSFLLDAESTTGPWCGRKDYVITIKIYSIVKVEVRMRWAGHVARMGEDIGVHRVLVEKPEVKRPLGRPRRRWEDNIKTDLQEVGGGRGDWMKLAQDRDRWRALVGTVRSFRVP